MSLRPPALPREGLSQSPHHPRPTAPTAPRPYTAPATPATVRSQPAGRPRAGVGAGECAGVRGAGRVRSRRSVLVQADLPGVRAGALGSAGDSGASGEGCRVLPGAGALDP